jgi:glycosyltransferase involved in cell wall biosynthesis
VERRPLGGHVTASEQSHPARIVVFGTYQAEDHPRVRVLAEGLAAHGYEILEINEPLGLTTDDRVRLLREPWRLPLLFAHLIRCWWRLWRRGRSNRDGVDAVLVGYLGHFDVHLARRVFPGVPVLLDHLIFSASTAADRGLSPGVRTRVLAQMDSSALQAADVIIVDTEEHAKRVPANLTDRVVVCRVGADATWFAARRGIAQRPGSGPLRVIFFGVFTPLQGTPVIAEALAELHDRTDLEVTMVGHGQDYQACRGLVPETAPVTWRNWVRAADLPAFVAEHDVVLGIFGTTPKAARVVPNKVYQGLAVGCGLITSDTPAQRRVLGEAVRYVAPGDAAALAGVLRSLADNRDEVAQLQVSARTLADRSFTAPEVTVPLAERIAACLGRRAPHR